jgi:integrase
MHSWFNTRVAALSCDPPAPTLTFIEAKHSRPRKPRVQVPPEGSIYQRESDGRWVVSLNLGADGQGKRRRRVFYGNEPTAVYDKIVKAIAERDQARAPADNRLPVRAFLERWLRDTADTRTRAKTRKTYRYIVEQHLIPGLGAHQLVRLGPADVQAFLNEKLRGGLAPRTVPHFRAVLRTALRWEMVYRSAAALADCPRVPRTEPDVPQPARAMEILAAQRGDRPEALYVLLMYLGMRQAEVMGLRWADVDWNRKTLRIAGTMQRIDGAFLFEERKVDRPRRLLPLTPFLADHLQARRERQREERAEAGSACPNSDLVFTGERGQPLHSSTVTGHLKILMDRAGLPSLTCRDLRHASATLHLMLGTDLRVVQEILGHTTIATAANVYTHVLEPTTRAAVERLGAALWQE